MLVAASLNTIEIYLSAREFLQVHSEAAPKKKKNSQKNQRAALADASISIKIGTAIKENT